MREDEEEQIVGRDDMILYLLRCAGRQLFQTGRNCVILFVGTVELAFIGDRRM